MSVCGRVMSAYMQRPLMANGDRKFRLETISHSDVDSLRSRVTLRHLWDRKYGHPPTQEITIKLYQKSTTFMLITLCPAEGVQDEQCEDRKKWTLLAKRSRVTACYQEILVHFCLFVCFWRDSPHWARASSLRRILDHTKRRTTVGRNPMDEWSARRRDLCLTTHNTRDRHPCPPWDSNPLSQQASGRRPTP
jgi:hypothetical protein